MKSIKTDEAASGATRQSRREALKKFGRYAAAAPTAMVLLQPRPSRAAGFRFGGWGFGGRRRRGGDHRHY